MVSISDTSKEISIHMSHRGSPRSSPSEGMRSSQDSDCIESKGTQPRSSNSETSKQSEEKDAMVLIGLYSVRSQTSDDLW